jgi:hypothetical protein
MLKRSKNPAESKAASLVTIKKGPTEVPLVVVAFQATVPKSSIFQVISKYPSVVSSAI